ncbi:MAG: hypothetical protein Udaeo2_14090 [Candidatus Udaeobacter sp.]|nr:MAG: hypothetical protein Udaeo2_14090 [Candidatus Udaeobacter sp.]
MKDYICSRSHFRFSDALLWESQSYQVRQRGETSLAALHLEILRLFDRAAKGTAISELMKKRYFVPFSVALMFLSCTVSMAFFRPRTLQASGYVLSALFGFQHVPGEFLLTTGTIVLIFISLFLAVAQERTQFIDRLALQPARIQVPAHVCAFLALELFPATGQVPFVYFQF